MANKKINIILACEYQIVCLGIANYIESHSKYQITHNASSLNDLYRQLECSTVDVVIIELSMLKPGGLAGIKHILSKSPGTRIIVVARSEKQPFISKSIDNGALGYISLQCEPKEIVEAIDTVLRGDKYLSKDVAYDFAISSLNKENELISSLTSREYQVFSQLAQGICVVDIAESLHISHKTVHVYRSSIMEKLRVENNSELTLLALKYSVISLDSLEL